MADTGWLSCSIGTQGSQSLVDWTNPDFIIDEDAALAGISLSSFQQSESLIGRSFGASLPDGSVVTGIEVRIVTGSILIDESAGGFLNVYLAKDAHTSNPTETTSPGVVVLTDTSGTEVIGGGSSNLWNTTWTEAEVESANFGIVINGFGGDGIGGGVSGNIDTVQVKIHYTEGEVEPGNATNTRTAWFRVM